MCLEEKGGNVWKEEKKVDKQSLNIRFMTPTCVNMSLCETGRWRRTAALLKTCSGTQSAARNQPNQGSSKKVLAGTVDTLLSLSQEGHPSAVINKPINKPTSRWE